MIKTRKKTQEAKETEFIKNMPEPSETSEISFSMFNLQALQAIPSSLSVISHEPFSLEQRLDPQFEAALRKYKSLSLKYKEEGFTQMSEMFIAKIASEKKIPKDIKASFALYRILIGVSKIFMLTEHELTIFACILDHCNWKVAEYVTTQEAYALSDVSILINKDDIESKKLIIYLMIYAFSLKQYIGDQEELMLIEAYIHTVCHNFFFIFNKWTRIPKVSKFTYHAQEINKKYKYLSKKESTEQMKQARDYNNLAENILHLTPKPIFETQPISTSVRPTKTPLFTNLPAKSEKKNKAEEKTANKFYNVESDSEYESSDIAIQSTKEQNTKISSQNKEAEEPKPSKKVKSDTNGEQIDNISELKEAELEELNLLATPALSKNPSNISMTDLDLPNFARFQSGISFYLNK